MKPQCFCEPAPLEMILKALVPDYTDRRETETMRGREQMQRQKSSVLVQQTQLAESPEAALACTPLKLYCIISPVSFYLIIPSVCAGVCRCSSPQGSLSL